MRKHEQVIQFIIKVQACFPGSIQHCTRGYCFEFSDLLINVFPEGQPWYDEDHMITKIGDNFYDITGQVLPCGHRQVKPGSVADKRIQRHKLNKARISRSY